MEAISVFGPGWLEQHLLPFCCPWQFCARRLGYACISAARLLLAAFGLYIRILPRLTRIQADQMELYLLKEECSGKDAAGESPTRKRKWAPV
jgi:hypothetical protein